ncbi:MAG TPA: class I SAM-dependent methyltransferase [Bacillota bacterium]|nr:class I SAM-dependent methyltransferase [Bacillota bacterium]
MDLSEVLNGYYQSHDEDSRLRSRHGCVEFLTTVRYIDKYLRPGMKILDIGAGTGIYSHHYARQGYEVDAVELIEHNIEKFRANTQPGERVTIWQGNAVSLDFIMSESYDVTLLLGPMYHLMDEKSKHAAMDEAFRVTKRGGVMFVSYFMSDPSIIGYCFLKGNLKKVLDAGLIDPKTFLTTSTPAEVFELYRREEIDALAARLDVKRLHFVGTDMYTNYFKEYIDSLDDGTFEWYLKYHFNICERPDMTGISHHTLDILKKR